MPLRAIARVLPDWTVDNDTIAEWTGLTPDFLTEKIGVRQRRFLRADEAGLGLAAAACRKLFESEPALEPDAIGLIVYVTQNPDYRLPHNSALLQTELGLRTNIGAFDINLGCSGFVYAISVVEALMQAQGISDALLVTCDPYSKVMRRDDRNVVGVFGDGATATWMSTTGGARIGKPDLGTDGSGAPHLIIRGDGSSSTPEDIVSAAATSDDRLPHIAMNGRAVFNFVVKNIPDSVKRCLSLNGLELGEIDRFAMHQGSRFMLQALRKQMRVPEEKMPIVLEETGNLVSSSIPYMLVDILRETPAPQRVLISGFGVGLSWATNVLFLEESGND